MRENGFEKKLFNSSESFLYILCKVLQINCRPFCCDSIVGSGACCCVLGMRTFLPLNFQFIITTCSVCCVTPKCGLPLLAFKLQLSLLLLHFARLSLFGWMKVFQMSVVFFTVVVWDKRNGTDMCSNLAFCDVFLRQFIPWAQNCTAQNVLSNIL